MNNLKLLDTSSRDPENTTIGIFFYSERFSVHGSLTLVYLRTFKFSQCVIRLLYHLYPHLKTFLQTYQQTEKQMKANSFTFQPVILH